MSSRDRRQRRFHGTRFGEAEDINPMNYVSNLSDVMLILAVGIMLALVLHWNVQIESAQEQTQETQSQEETVEFSDEDLQNQEDIPDNVEKAGEVYYDSVTGTYYILKNSE